MHISSEPHQGTLGGVPLSSSSASLGQDLFRVSHNLMGSISALLMCEHMLSKELAPTPEWASNEVLRTTPSLLKETVDQIRDYGDELMGVSLRYKQAADNNGPVA